MHKIYFELDEKCIYDTDAQTREISAYNSVSYLQR